MANDVDWTIKHSNKYAYDRVGDEAREEEGYSTPKGTDWSIIAARAVLGDMSDRGGVRHELDSIDYEVRDEMVETLANIIKKVSDNRETYMNMNFNTEE